MGPGAQPWVAGQRYVTVSVSAHARSSSLVTDAAVTGMVRLWHVGRGLQADARTA